MTRLRIRVVCTAVGLLVSLQSLGAQAPTSQANPQSKEEKIQNAMSAAPEAIAKEATILDYPEKEGGEMAALRQGTNGWTCLPDDPSTPANDPMCLDQVAMVWAQAWMTKKEPKLTAPGLGYMLQGGGQCQ